MKLVVGLGNPGAIYQLSRHNLGFMVVDNLALAYHILLEKKRFHALWGQGIIAEEEVVLAQPQTFMNLSGQAVASLAKHFALPISRIMVIHDDLDLALGRIKISIGGGDAGHQGIRSIIDWLEDPSFLRVRLGIERPPAGSNPSDYVLSPFTEEEWKQVNEMVTRAQEAITCLLKEGPATAMNRFNR